MIESQYSYNENFINYIKQFIKINSANDCKTNLHDLVLLKDKINECAKEVIKNNPNIEKKVKKIENKINESILNLIKLEKSFNLLQQEINNKPQPIFSKISLPKNTTLLSEPVIFKFSLNEKQIEELLNSWENYRTNNKLDEILIMFLYDYSNVIISMKNEQLEIRSHFIDSIETTAFNPLFFNTISEAAKNLKTVFKNTFSPLIVIPVCKKSEPEKMKEIKETETTIYIKCDSLPWGHTLTICGKGGNLGDWNTDIPLEKVKEGFYSHKMSGVKEKVEFKIRLDAEQWESYEGNHAIEAGETLELTPSLNMPKTLIVVNGSKDNRLSIRGTGPKMTWEEGPELLHLGDGRFVFEVPTQTHYNPFLFKIVKNNTTWCQGDNLSFTQGEKPLEITPKF